MKTGCTPAENVNDNTKKHPSLFTEKKSIDPLHKWQLNLNNNTHTSLASQSCKNSFLLKHECEAKDVESIVIQIQAKFMQRVYCH